MFQGLDHSRALRAIACTLFFSLLLLACDEEVPPESDAGSRPDAGMMAMPDAGPEPTGCEAPSLDGGMPASDAGTLEPGAYPPPTGPGAPNISFAEDELGVACAFMQNGPTDEDHHNTGFYLDGYFVRPWAHERGKGGIAIWDLSEPCSPNLVANVLDDQIRETHSTGVSYIGGRTIAVASLTGIQFWDMADVTAPEMINDFTLEGVRYPDSYARVVMSAVWQAPYLYVGASDNGIFIVEASDPRNPEVIGRFVPDPLFRVAQVVVAGTLLYAFSSQGSVVETFDIRDPANPRPIPGARYDVTDGELDRLGRPRPFAAYFGHMSGGYTYHPRQGIGGGLAVFDVRDPANPTFVGDFNAPGTDGGYVYLKEGIAYVGLSDHALSLDVRDPAAMTMVRRFDLEGDVDTITPLGNVAVVSVDEDAMPGEASIVVPVEREPDTTSPSVNFVVPSDGAEDQSLLTRIGLSFTEFVMMESVWEGSIVLREVSSGNLIPTHLSGQEGIVHIVPRTRLQPETQYEVLVPAGGVADISGNAIETGFRSTFTTNACGGI